MGDVLDHPLGDQELAQLRQLHVENGRPWSAGRDLAIFLISRRWAKVNFGRWPPLVSRIQRAEPIGVDVVDDIADPVLAGEGDNHVVEYQPDNLIGWEPEAGRGHPNAEPRSRAPCALGQRWSFELTPDGADATIVTEIFDCSQVPEDQRVDIDHGNIWIEAMHQTLERLDQLCTSQPGTATRS